MLLLETERLLLLPPNLDLLPLVFDYFIRNREHFMPWGPKHEPAWDTEEYHRNKIIQYCEKMADGNSLWVFIFEKNHPDKILGDIHFSNVVRGIFQSCNVGYRLDENEQRKGYMREALQRSIEYAFNDMKLHRIEANIIPVNERSIKLVKSLGFEEEGLAKKYLKIAGRWQDHVHYTLLNDALEE